MVHGLHKFSDFQVADNCWCRPSTPFHILNSGQSHESNGSGSTWAIFTVAFLPLLLSEGAMAAETELLCVAGNQFHGRHRLQLSAILTASVCH